MTRPITTLRTPARRPVAKAKTEGLVAVYDQQGNLVGLADPADITPVSSAGGSSSGGKAKPPAPSPEKQQAAETARVTGEEVEKALRRLRIDAARPAIQKSLGSSKTVEGKYDALIDSLPSHVADQIRSTVALRSTMLVVSGGVAGPAAVGIIKTAVLAAARRVGR
jgi:hypothetical protein